MCPQLQSGNIDRSVERSIVECCGKIILVLNKFLHRKVSVDEVKAVVSECSKVFEEIFQKNYDVLVKNPQYANHLNVLLQVFSLAENIDYLGAKYGYDFLRDEMLSLVELYSELRKQVKSASIQ